ncbi:MAG TPA: hypothetical protein VFY84_03255 [Jiangellales bacterium]|nr:hypothetical protein [Jiangellales bacterium]
MPEEDLDTHRLAAHDVTPPSRVRPAWLTTACAVGLTVLLTAAGTTLMIFVESHLGHAVLTLGLTVAIISYFEYRLTRHHRAVAADHVALHKRFDQLDKRVTFLLTELYETVRKEAGANRRHLTDLRDIAEGLRLDVHKFDPYAFFASSVQEWEEQNRRQ